MSQSESNVVSISGLSKKKKKKKNGNGEKDVLQRKSSWDAYIQKYRKYIRSVKAVVDDKPPLLDVTKLYDEGELKNSQQSVAIIFRINEELLKEINYIDRFGGRTETFGFNYKRALTTNYESRKYEAMLIEDQNKMISKALENVTCRVETVEELGKHWKRYENAIANRARYPLFWKVKEKKQEKIEIGPPVPYFKQYVTEKSSKYHDKRPRVFFEISIAGIGSVGKMQAVLFSDYVPMTVKNFLAFCDPKADLTYKGNRFYLIFQNYFCLTGDVVENLGFGGTSIYGPYFGDEDHTLRHGERGVLTMYSKIPNRNKSQFLITFRPLHSMDNTNVVFGKIKKGFHVLDAIESVGSKKTGRPKVDIYISDCDEI